MNHQAQNTKTNAKASKNLPTAVIVALLLTAVALTALVAIWLLAPAPASLPSHAMHSHAVDSTNATNNAHNWLDTAYPLAARGSAKIPSQPEHIIPRQHLQNGLVINFWATWCPPCVRELPLLNQRQAQLLGTAQPHAPVIAIAIDSPEAVQRFLKKTPLPNLIPAIAGMEGVATLRQAGNTNAQLPYTLVLDNTGNIVHQHTGELTAQQINQLQSFVQSGE